VQKPTWLEICRSLLIALESHMEKIFSTEEMLNQNWPEDTAGFFNETHDEIKCFHGVASEIFSWCAFYYALEDPDMAVTISPEEADENLLLVLELALIRPADILDVAAAILEEQRKITPMHFKMLQRKEEKRIRLSWESSMNERDEIEFAHSANSTIDEIRALPDEVFNAKVRKFSRERKL